MSPPEPDDVSAPHLRMKFVLSGLLLFLVTASFAAVPAIIPQPQLLVQTNVASFTLCPAQTVIGAPTPAPTRILVNEACRDTAEYLSLIFHKSTGLRFEIATNSGSSPVAQAIL